jgi:hypothetical protein
LPPTSPQDSFSHADLRGKYRATNSARPSASARPVNGSDRAQERGSRGAFAEPVEISDPIRAPPISLSPWLICLRSGKSEESKRLTYSAFFTDKYVSSRYSAIVDDCGEQGYHPLKAN